MLRALVRGFLVVGIVSAFLLAAPSAQASHPCIFDCRVHWGDNSTYYHFTSNLVNNYPQFQTPSNRAHEQWVNATSPNSPWHTHYDTASGNHVDVATAPNPDYLAFYTLTYDGNSARHLNRMYIAIDSRDVGVFYTGTGTPPSNRYDAWSALAEE